MKVIVCLGNPGDQYHWTRHNVGFLMADQLVSDFSLSKKGQKFKAIIYEGFISDVKVWVVKPQTFMNLSGETVRDLMAFFKLPLSDLLVVYDDFDLPFNTLRYRVSGSAGTHNGMKSIIQCLGGAVQFSRLRVGIGPLPQGVDVSSFVLAPFSELEKSALPSLFKTAQDHIKTWVVG